MSNDKRPADRPGNDRKTVRSLIVSYNFQKINNIRRFHPPVLNVYITNITRRQL